MERFVSYGNNKDNGHIRTDIGIFPIFLWDLIVMIEISRQVLEKQKKQTLKSGIQPLFEVSAA